MPKDDSRTGAVSAGGLIETVRLGDAAQLRRGQRIGHYKILEQIGEGGFAEAVASSLNQRALARFGL